MEGYSSLSERIAWKIWKASGLNRKMMNMSNGRMKNWMVNKIFTAWTAHRSNLDFSPKTFNEMWIERNKDN